MPMTDERQILADFICDFGGRQHRVISWHTSDTKCQNRPTKTLLICQIYFF